MKKAFLIFLLSSNAFAMHAIRDALAAAALSQNFKEVQAVICENSDDEEEVVRPLRRMKSKSPDCSSSKTGSRLFRSADEKEAYIIILENLENLGDGPFFATISDDLNDDAGMIRQRVILPQKGNIELRLITNPSHLTITHAESGAMQALLKVHDGQNISFSLPTKVRL